MIEYTELAVSCIVIGIASLVVGIIVASFFPGTSRLEGSPVSLIGSASLIFAATNTKGNTQTRTNTIFLYIETCVLQIFIVILHWELTLTTFYSGGWIWNISERSHLYVLLNVFCTFVAFSFYQELNGKDAKLQVHARNGPFHIILIEIPRFKAIGVF